MSYLSELNPKQIEAVKAVEGPVMVVAGPGSGKTRVLTYRIAHLIQIGVPAYRILALTFTNKAASEMKERIVKIVGEKSRQLWMGTFHSVFARILRVECELLGFGRNFTIYDTADSLGLIKNIMNSLGVPQQQYNPQAIRSRISGAKNQMIGPTEYAAQALDLFAEKTGRVYAEYDRRLRQHNAMDFDDLLLKPIELFQRHKKTLEKYRDLFRFVLIDEYQDTNRTQYVLIKTIAEKYRNICVVGDDAQSIYAFRGADIRNILDFQNDYSDLKTIRLEQNYRSTKTILAAADHLIKHNQDQISKSLWTENPEGETITLLSCDDDRDEGNRIVARVFDESRRLKIDLKDFAIMYRTNAQSRSLEDALRKNSIPYIIVGGIEFYQRKEVKDALAYLRIVVNPQDGESFLRIANYPVRGLGAASLERLQAFAAERNLSLLSAAGKANEIDGLSQRAKVSFLQLFDFFTKYEKLKREISLTELSRSMIEETGMLALLKDEATAESLERWQNVQELLSALSEFAAQRDDATLEAFLQDVSLVSAVDNLDPNRNAVTLMTLHSAKGLEYPVVFITGLEEGLLPLYNSSLDRKEIEEERRLFYVGITRAMTKLYLSTARMRFRYGETAYQSPSRFLEEIPDELTDELVVRTKRLFKTRADERSGKFAFDRGASEFSPKAAAFHSDPEPDYESDIDALELLKIGKLVEHSDFGQGKIIGLSGEGDSMKAVVDFDSVGRKNLMLKYARLKVL